MKYGPHRFPYSISSKCAHEMHCSYSGAFSGAIYIRIGMQMQMPRFIIPQFKYSCAVKAVSNVCTSTRRWELSIIQKYVKSYHQLSNCLKCVPRYTGGGCMRRAHTQKTPPSAFRWRFSHRKKMSRAHCSVCWSTNVFRSSRSPTHAAKCMPTEFEYHKCKGVGDHVIMGENECDHNSIKK